MTLYVPEIHFGPTWLPMQKGFPSQEEALWAIREWKMAHNMRDDSALRIRRIELPDTPFDLELEDLPVELWGGRY